MQQLINPDNDLSATIGAAMDLAARGVGHDDTVIGGRGDDVLRGGDGDDLLNGKEGDDTIKGGVGDDTIRGGHGADMMKGGAGADLFVFDDLGDARVNGPQDEILDITNKDVIDLPRSTPT